MTPHRARMAAMTLNATASPPPAPLSTLPPPSPPSIPPLPSAPGPPPPATCADLSFLMIRRPPRSTLFPYRRSSDLTLHGGVHAALLDTIIGQSIAQQAESPVATINLSIYYSAPAKRGSTLTAKGNIVQMGKSIASGEGVITDENGVLIAKGIGAFKILKRKTN